MAGRLAGTTRLGRLLPCLWHSHALSVPRDSCDALHTISARLDLLLPGGLFPFLQYRPGEHRDCKRNQTRGSGDRLCRRDFYYARFRRRDLSSADWSCRRSLEPRDRLPGRLVHDAGGGLSLAGGARDFSVAMRRKLPSTEEFRRLCIYIGCAYLVRLLMN